MKEKDLKRLKNFVIDHVFGNKFNSYGAGRLDLEDFISYVKVEFPHFISSQKGKRIVFLMYNKDFDNSIKIGTSFTASNEGLRSFFKNCMSDTNYSGKKYIALLEGDILTLDLNRIIWFLQDNAEIDSHEYLSEDEILSAEDTSLPYQIFTIKQFQEYLRELS